MEYASLSNQNGFTVFRYMDYVIRFKAPYSLEKYTAVKEWDNGYLVVMVKHRYNSESEEEYIDLVPILENIMNLKLLVIICTLHYSVRLNVCRFTPVIRN